MKKQAERDKKGRFAKGHKGGPGRPKGEPKDIICKDGKKRSVDALIDDLLATYGTLGGSKFLKKWAMQSHGNLRKFIEILFKFAPQPDVVAGDVNVQVITAVPRINDSAAAKRIRELEAELRKKDKELERIRAPIDVQDVKEIEHKPVRPVELPEHIEKRASLPKEKLSGSWLDFRALSDEKIEKKLKKLSGEDMEELYKKLEREVGLRIDPENYKRPVIIRNFMLLWTRKKKDEREKAARGEELVPLTKEETDRVMGSGRRGLS